VERRMQYILTLNGGSSSIKYALFEGEGSSPGFFRQGRPYRFPRHRNGNHRPGDWKKRNICQSRRQIMQRLFQPLAQVLEKRVDFTRIAAVAHRIVHGGIPLQ